MTSAPGRLLPKLTVSAEAYMATGARSTQHVDSAVALASSGWVVVSYQGVNEFLRGSHLEPSADAEQST
jgi:hypothetical protein